MKSYLIPCLLLLLVLVGATGTAVSLCNYSSPNTDISDLGISFSYHYYNNPYGLSDHDINAGQLKIDYTQLFDSPDFGFDLSVRNDMTISVLSLSSYLVTADGNLKRYFSPDAPYFGFAGVSGKSASSYETIGLSVKFGVGYGRFVDVTPLAKAVKLDAYLVRQKSISEHLDDIDLQAIAYEIESIATYDSLANLLTVIEEFINATGLAKTGGLDALDIYEMARIIEDDSCVRYCGGDIKVGIGYEILDPLGGPNDLMATMAFNYAFTSTPKAQFLIQGALSGSHDILHTHRLGVTLGYDYVITDTINLSSSYSFSREMWEDVPTDIHNLSLNLVLIPVKEARVTLGIRLGHEPYYLEWCKDISLLISMDLL